MTTFKEYARVHWNASDEAHTDCTFRYRGITTTVRVLYEERDLFDLSGHFQSKSYTIDYLHEDMPHLAQDDALTVVERDGTSAKYRVREPPYVDEQRGMDGTYRCAVLTRDQGRDS
jgi:hypothetical protein